MRTPAVLAAWLVVLSSAPALAAAPRLVPERDVTVDYTVHASEAPLQAVRVSIEAGGRRLRISAQDLPAIFLVDRPAGTATILVPLLRGYATASISRYDPEVTILRGARFTKGGAEMVAGLACTDWKAVSASGSAAACITPDGIILKGSATDRHGGTGSVVASSVAYGGLDPSTFERPEDYKFVGDLPPGLLGMRR
jgi:hypothetical protein